MAGLKDSFSKGLTTINVKASNFMEENKFKTHISTLESEIASLKSSIGEKIYQGYINEAISLESVAEELALVKEKYATISKINEEIENLNTKEKEILGNTAVNNMQQGGVQFCGQCGAPYKTGYKFCEKCGNKLD